MNVGILPMQQEHFEGQSKMRCVFRIECVATNMKCKSEIISPICFFFLDIKKKYRRSPCKLAAQYLEN